MPRGFVLWLIVMSAIGWGVYQLKYQVQTLEGQLTRTNREIVAEQDAIHVLKAEWSYLNQPRQISQMAKKFLEVTPIGPRQMATLSMIPTRAEGAVPVVKPATPARKPAAAAPPALVAKPAPAPGPAPGPAIAAPLGGRPAPTFIPADSVQLVRNNGVRQ